MSALTKWNPLRSEIEPWEPFAPWNPFQEMERMLQEMDRMFNGGRTRLPERTKAMGTEWYPVADVMEDEKEYVVKVELPEVKKEDVKVTIEHGSLCIRGERKAEKEEKAKHFRRLERAYGRFERSFSLPDETETAKISSEFKDGLLTVHLPRNPEAKPKTIEVKVH
jgi:HSP20 family protein